MIFTRSVSSVVICTRRFASALSSSIRLTSWSRASASASSVTMGFRRSTVGFLAPSDDGEDEVPNMQLLCSCSNRAKATKGSHGFRMKMAELRAPNVAEGMMVDERLAVLTGRRLAQYHREGNGRSV